ncbi:DUF3298 and DUF4163 domain-containing protein [Pseudoxanthomonas winnipegensis]|uniref:DUF3298 and DUF4163 domain-containing protein n=1 Tax=Pseudoxanthomonas winnipegensis TaxID=2480810 RepID=UPI001F419B18|nr:DUF3298 and DUF4163 domain-containing protein [Pseudoxanthomonas winnipegensis]
MGTGKTIVPALLVAGLLAACSPSSTPPQASAPANGTAPASTAPAASAPPAQAALADVAESDPRYVIGISYPPQINQYPGLAKAVGDYAGAARQGLMEAVKDLGQEKPTAPYELSLAFDMVANTPEVVAVSGNGSRYTGGAHGEPLVARFTWLPQRQTLLTTQSLLTQGKGLEAVSGYVREQLHTAASLRNDDPGMSPEDRASLLQSATQMIDEGTAPKLENFSLFQPVMNADGKITALRFVFPPYQVGPYSDGTQTVDVPAQVLAPYLAPEDAGLFVK